MFVSGVTPLAQPSFNDASCFMLFLKRLAGNNATARALSR